MFALGWITTVLGALIGETEGKDVLEQIQEV